MGVFSIFRKSRSQSDNEVRDLEAGLAKSKESLLGKLSRAIAGRSKVDEEVLDSLEELLITSDVGVDTTVKIIERIEKRVARQRYTSTGELDEILRSEIATMLAEREEPSAAENYGKVNGMPYVVMVVGVNGVGKTTTIGKIAARLTASGKKVFLGAADTFRAAAIEQLCVWGERAGATVVKQSMGSDPASVAFDTLKSAVANGADVAIIDTAGRLHNKVNLMNELSKIRNVMSKVVPDGSTGQNAIEQARQFTEATKVTALAVTKLDGTARGGVVIGISDRFSVPVRFIGVGEGVEHLQQFDSRLFVETLFKK